MIPDYTPNIWKWLKANTRMTDEGIAAVMGNMESESNCEPMRVQGDFSSNRANSKVFSEHVDGGNTDIFFSGKYGWGLCQWTYPARCRNLYDFCKSRGTSISDLESQLAFMLKELQTEYTSVYNNLLNSSSIEKNTESFMRSFENPYDQSQAAINGRISNAKSMYAKFHGKQISEDISNSPILDDVVTEEMVTITLPRSVVQKLYIALFNSL